MDIQNVTFIFENQEHIRINPYNIKHLCLDQVQQTIHLNTQQMTSKKALVTKHVRIIIEKSANQLSTVAEYFLDPYLLFDRLTNHQDVLVVVLNYGLPTQEEYEVDWNMDNEYSNSHQTTKIDKHGNLELIIAKDSSLAEKR